MLFKVIYNIFKLYKLNNITSNVSQQTLTKLHLKAPAMILVGTICENRYSNCRNIF